LIAQNVTGTIRGTITDVANHQPLIRATVLLDDSVKQKGTVTDNDGNFRFDEVVVGHHSLTVSYLGYEAVTISNIILTSGKEIVQQVELQEQIITANEFIITARKKLKQIMI